MIILSCIYCRCTSYTAIEHIAAPDLSDTSGVRLEGMYNTLDPKYPTSASGNDVRYTAYNYVVFTKERGVYINNGAHKDSLPFTCAYYKERKAKGWYEIKGDTIFAYAPTTFVFGGSKYRSYYASYKGYLKNRETITDWKVVPPYPDKIGKAELEAIENSPLFTPHVIYFMPNEGIKCLETAIDKQK